MNKKQHFEQKAEKIEFWSDSCRTPVKTLKRLLELKELNTVLNAKAVCP